MNIENGIYQSVVGSENYYYHSKKVGGTAYNDDGEYNNISIFEIIYLGIEEGYILLENGAYILQQNGSYMRV